MQHGPHVSPSTEFQGNEGSCSHWMANKSAMFPPTTAEIPASLCTRLRKYQNKEKSTHAPWARKYICPGHENRAHNPAKSYENFSVHIYRVANLCLIEAIMGQFSAYEKKQNNLSN